MLQATTLPQQAVVLQVTWSVDLLNPETHVDIKKPQLPCMNADVICG